MTDIKTTPTKTRKTPIPQGYERILQGALKLVLADRVLLKSALQESVNKELDQRQKQLDEAKAIVNGGQ